MVDVHLTARAPASEARHPPRRMPLCRFALILGTGLSLAGCGTATSQHPPAPAPLSGAGGDISHVDMDTMKLEATRTPTGIVQIDSYDAQELFDRGSKALTETKLDDAIRYYDKLLASFPDSAFARAALYNKGLAHRDKKDWPAAVEAFKKMAEVYAEHIDAKDALFQLGACYAEQQRWVDSRDVFVRILQRKDLNADDRIEAMARRGFAQLSLGDLDTAEASFMGLLAFRTTIDKEERLATDFFLAFAQYNLGQIFHQRFLAAPIRLPESQMDKDLDQKAKLLLTAQRRYIEAIKFGHPGWASAAGFQVGTLYEELYAAFIAAPIPSELGVEAREVYIEELHKRIRILLEKSLRWYRENLLMIERMGVDTDWAVKSKVAYAKLLRLLDPSTKAEFGQPTAPAAPPVVGPAPPVAPGSPDRSAGPPKPPADDTGKRQIL